MTTKAFRGAEGASLEPVGGDVRVTRCLISRRNNGAVWNLMSLSAFVSEKLNLSLGSSVLLRIDGDDGLELMSNDLVRIWLRDFPTLVDLEAYEVRSGATSEIFTGNGRVAVSAGAASAARALAAAAAPKGSSPFNPPPPRAKAKASGLPLPSNAQYEDMRTLRQKKVLLASIDKKLHTLAEARAGADYFGDYYGGADEPMGDEEGGEEEETHRGATSASAARPTARQVLQPSACLLARSVAHISD